MVARGVAAGALVALFGGGGAFAEVPVTFQLQPPREAGLESACLAVGDFNEDGAPDVAVGNYGDDTLTVFYGDGQGAYAEETLTFPSGGESPVAIEAEYVDGDAHLDLVVAHFDDYMMSVLLGDGQGGFVQAPGSPFLTGRYPRGLDLGDIDHDGDQDLVVTSRFEEAVYVFFGDGTGAFEQSPDSPYVIRYGRGPTGIRLGRFSPDGHQDFAVVCSDSWSMSVFYGDGQGGFVQPERPNLRTGRHPKYIVKGHFNVDFFVDVAVINQETSNVTVFLGDGTGWFDQAPGSPYAVGPLPRHLDIGDFNRDGRRDLITSDSGGVTLTHLQGDGRGRFRFMGDLVSDQQPLQPRIVDLDGDRRPDLAVANRLFGTLTTMMNVTDRFLEDLVVEETEAGTLVSFAPVSGAQAYDFIRGQLGGLEEWIPHVSVGDVVCLENDSADPSLAGNEDTALPPPGGIFFYLARYQDGGSGSYGPSSRNFERRPLNGDCAR